MNRILSKTAKYLPRCILIGAVFTVLMPLRGGLRFGFPGALPIWLQLFRYFFLTTLTFLVIWVLCDLLFCRRKP